MFSHAHKYGCVMLGVILGTCAVVRADWNPGDPAKWVQLPDLTPNGIDVLDTSPKILANDFLCTSPGPITDVHIWGSWLNDQLPLNSAGLPDATAVTFKLSFHADIPAGTSGGASSPGAQLYSIITPATAVRVYSTGPEGFFNPNTGQYQFPGDSTTWQYNFTNIPNPFIQQGTAANPIVYWLDVQALPATANATFGWKTAIPPDQLDDSVYGDTTAFGGVPPTWTPMVYPSGSQYAGQSLDLAFVITSNVPEPASLMLLGLGSLGLLRRRR